MNKNIFKVLGISTTSTPIFVVSTSSDFPMESAKHKSKTNKPTRKKVQPKPMPLFEQQLSKQEVANKFLSAFKKQQELKRNRVSNAYPIMDTSNAHNKELVEKINIIWNRVEYRKRFILIVKALSIRDAEECEDKGVNPITTDDDVNDYLMHVADDIDLSTIINFVRCHDEKTENGQILASFK